MAARGRGNIACTPEIQFRLLWLIGRGWTRGEAAAACGMHPDTVTRHGYRDPLFSGARRCEFRSWR